MMILAAANNSVMYVFLGSIAALIVIFSGALPSIKTAKAQKTIEIQAAGIVARDQANSDLRQELVKSEARCRAEIQELKASTAAQIGELRGQIRAMTPEFAKMVAHFLYEEGVKNEPTVAT